MPTKINPSSLSPRLPKGWDAPEHTTHAQPAEVDQLLQRAVSKVRWQGASTTPMTLDPTTRKPMVDPVLCSDGRLHDRIATRALAYLDTDANPPRDVQVLGHDQGARAAVHDLFPVGLTMLKAREALSTHIASTHPLQASTQGPDGIDRQEALNFGAYQMRKRRGEWRFEADHVIGRTAIRPRPLSFSRNTFTHFNVLSEPSGWLGAFKHVLATPSQCLVDHLADHHVLQGRGREQRLLGCLENLDRALDTFKLGGRGLTDTQKAGASKYVHLFAHFSRQAWRSAAEIEHCFSLFEQNEKTRRLYASQPLAPAESQALERFSRYTMVRLSSIYRDMEKGKFMHAETDVPSLSGAPAPTRWRSLPDMRLTDDIESMDPEMFTCPLLLEAAPAPILYSDGRTYDLIHTLQPIMDTSPFTNQPMHVIGRHAEKQQYAAHHIDKQDGDYFKTTYEVLRASYPPKHGNLSDRIIAYQRRKRFMSRHAYPDKISTRIFSKFLHLSAMESTFLMLSLQQQGLFNRGLDRRIAPESSGPRIREMVVKSQAVIGTLAESQKDKITLIISLLYDEQNRRQPLVAQARFLARQLARLPKDSARYAEIKDQLEQVDRDLHRLPSGVDDQSKLPLY